jgi:hypothetical protein
MSFIQLRLVAYYIFVRTLNFSLSTSLRFPQQQLIAPHEAQPGVIQSELSETMGASSKAPPTLP